MVERSSAETAKNLEQKAIDAEIELNHSSPEGAWDLYKSAQDSYLDAAQIYTETGMPEDASRCMSKYNQLKERFG